MYKDQLAVKSDIEKSAKISTELNKKVLSRKMIREKQMQVAQE